MDYAEQTRNIFDSALQYFECLKLKSSVSTIEQKKLCIMCQKFLETYVRWMTCSEAEAKAYQVFVRSTPLWEMLELPRAKWVSWIKANIQETVVS